MPAHPGRPLIGRARATPKRFGWNVGVKTEWCCLYEGRRTQKVVLFLMFCFVFREETVCCMQYIEQRSVWVSILSKLSKLLILPSDLDACRLWTCDALLSPINDRSTVTHYLLAWWWTQCGLSVLPHITHVCWGNTLNSAHGDACYLLIRV